jgi:glycosyltransferase involved in cell wall biosynthesis
MEISIIVRFYNEEAYLPQLMEVLAQQEFPTGEFEILAIDNYSTDSSREVVSRYTRNILSVDDYRPGKALNLAIGESRSKYIAVVSAHAIPSNRAWLRTLHAHMSNELVAGVYGAQLYPADSRFLDKRDLDIFSTLTPRVEKEDSDFWNANSMFRRALWEVQPFDETVYELEGELVPSSVPRPLQ